MSLVQKIDSLIMGYSNQVVRLYNYVTGGTKADLTRDLLSIASVVETAGFTNSINKPWDYMVLCVPSLYSFNLQKKFRNLESDEEVARKEDALDLEVEEKKEKGKIYGGLWFLCALTWYAPLSTDKELGSLGITNEISDNYVGLGVTLRSLSYFIIAADNLPPRKNIFNRTLEKMRDWQENKIRVSLS